jgi:hypothetical protein
MGIVDTRHWADTVFSLLSRECSDYEIHDGQGEPLPDLPPNLEIHLVPNVEPDPLSGFRICLVWDGFGKDAMQFALCTQPIVTRDTPRSMESRI